MLFQEEKEDKNQINKSHSGDCDGFAAVFFRSAHAAFFYGYL